MALIGMLHSRKSPYQVTKAYPFAAVAKLENIDFIYFSFDSVDFDDMKVSGWVYENREWKQKQMEIPSVIINSCNPKNKKQADILEKLKKKAVLTSHAVGNKLKVYKKILEGKVFAKHLIPSKLLTTPEKLMIFLDIEQSAVIKPLKGNHGNLVIFLEKVQDNYQVTEGNTIQSLNRQQLCNFIEQKTRGRQFLFQPFIKCKTKAGLAYDFRLHVQKNGEGLWEINLIYPRISGGLKLISNIKSGGYRGELDSFLTEEFAENARNIKRSIEKFALNFPAHFETLYPYGFDELGIDVGIDEKGRIWIFEVNWRPGCKNREFEVARRLIPYCHYLFEQNRLSE